MEYRIESDSLGQKQVPATAYYGIQSLRAKENFQISGKKAHPEFIKAIIEVKKGSALTNKEVGAIEEKIANAILMACDEILAGGYQEHFIVDVVQGGAGTSFNMNANEVIANRALELLHKQKGNYAVVHPNDHVNCAQSTNDVFPSAGKIATIRLLQKTVTRLREFHTALENKANELRNVIKMGRTEMQDAVPITFGQTFSAYAQAVKRDIARFELAIDALSTLNMGGTAIGTGITAKKEYIDAIVPNIAKITNLSLRQAEDLVDGTQNVDCFVFVSGIIKSCASSLSKIANDLRLMSSGPRTGFNEINLPAKQAGSSIMPGKINPVIPEVINQIAFKIIGNDATITLASEAGQLELNAFEPIIFYCLFESLEMLANGLSVFTKDCIEGITINVAHCKKQVENSIGIVTALCPHIGYTQASALAKKALREGKIVREVLLEEKIVKEEEIDDVLNPLQMV